MFNLSAFLMYSFITACTPGPNNIMAMGQAMQYGIKKSFPFTLGIFFGFTMVMIVCTFLSATFSYYLPQFNKYLTFIGSGYMFYLAWKVWKSSFQDNTDEKAHAGFFAGMVLQFINPKIYIYAVTIMFSYVLPVYDSFWALIGFAVILACIGYIGTILWALFGQVFYHIFEIHTKIINEILALLLIYCAISLFL